LCYYIEQLPRPPSYPRGHSTVEPLSESILNVWIPELLKGADIALVGDLYVAEGVEGIHKE
jgi:hypothetical protein